MGSSTALVTLIHAPLCDNNRLRSPALPESVAMRAKTLVPDPSEGFVAVVGDTSGFGSERGIRQRGGQHRYIFVDALVCKPSSVHRPTHYHSAYERAVPQLRCGSTSSAKMCRPSISSTTRNFAIISSIPASAYAHICSTTSSGVPTIAFIRVLACSNSSPCDT